MDFDGFGCCGAMVVGLWIPMVLGVVVRWWQGNGFQWLDSNVWILMVLGVMVRWFEGLWISMVGF